MDRTLTHAARACQERKPDISFGVGDFPSDHPWIGW